MFKCGRKALATGGLVLALTGIAGAVAAPAAPEFSISIRDHEFQPAEIRVPANVKVVLVIENKDATAEEFESYELHREKIIAGNKTAKIFIGPLEPGRYPFFGEFNPKTAQGVVVAE